MNHYRSHMLSIPASTRYPFDMYPNLNHFFNTSWNFRTQVHISLAHNIVGLQ